MLAPVVPMKLARDAPTIKSATFALGVHLSSPLNRTPPAVTKRAPSVAMNETYEVAVLITSCARPV